MGKYVELTDANFDETVLKSSKPVLVDFWASWCGPCKMLAPAIAELAEDYAGRALVCKVNVDECPQTSERYGIMSIPTVLLFKNGAEAGKTVGVQPKSKLAQLIDAQL